MQLTGHCPLCGGVFEVGHRSKLVFRSDRVDIVMDCPDGKGETLAEVIPVGKVSETPAIPTFNTEIHKAIQALTRKVE
jgi:hypothetical protein